jgi:hypothetical protein
MTHRKCPCSLELGFPRISTLGKLTYRGTPNRRSNLAPSGSIPMLLLFSCWMPGIGAHEVNKKTEVGCRFRGSLRDSRNVHKPPDGLSDRLQCDTILGDRVVSTSRCSFFKRQPEELRCITTMHCRPAVESAIHVGRNPSLALQGDHSGDEALLRSIMNNRRKPDDT